MRLASSLAPLLLCLAPCVGQKVAPPSGEVPLRVSPSVERPSADGAITRTADRQLGTGQLATDMLAADMLATDMLGTDMLGTGKLGSWLTSDSAVAASAVSEPLAARFPNPPEAPLEVRDASSRPASSRRSPSAPAPEGPPPVPEPSTLLLVGTGLIGVALTSRLTRRRPKTD